MEEFHILSQQDTTAGIMAIADSINMHIEQ
jgi:hypothetical protein